MGLLPGRYSRENLRMVLAHPQMAVGELNRLANRLNRRVIARVRDPDGVDVMAEDWDTLIILDGCRFDVYSEQSTLPGQLERRTSPGSESWEFMQANFAGRELHDTVYVTANPHAHRLAADTFHDVVDLLDEHWDPQLQTVKPEDVAMVTLETHEQYPHKRLVVHFMQPHFPFVGPTGRAIEQGGIVFHRDGSDEHQDVWGQLEYGLLEVSTVWRAYRENLDIALRAVEDLYGELGGKTVVTADHGNLIGDRLWPLPTRGYGHPPGLPVPELLEVPWHVLDHERRRQVRADPPRERHDPDDDVVESRLASLGYQT